MVLAAIIVWSTPLPMTNLSLSVSHSILPSAVGVGVADCTRVMAEVPMVPPARVRSLAMYASAITLPFHVPDVIVPREVMVEVFLHSTSTPVLLKNCPDEPTASLSHFITPPP